MQSITNDAIRHRLDHILNRDFDNLYKQQKPLIPSPDQILDRQLFTKLSDFYQSCMNQDLIEQANIKPLYPLFRVIREHISLRQDQVSPEGLNRALSFLSDRNIWALFEMKIEPDMIYNANKPSLSLWQGQVGLPRPELYDDPDTLSVYMQVVTSILDLVFKQDVSNEFGWKSWSAVATARRIVDFEKKLAQATLITDQLQPEQWSLERLEQEAPPIQWTRFIQQHLPNAAKSPDYVLIPTPEFIKHLSKDVLSTTNTRTLQTYFIWRTIWKYLDMLGEQYVAPKRKLDAKLSGVVPRALPERRDICIDTIDKSALGLLMGRYYVLDHQERISKSKDKVKMIVQNTTQVLIDRVPHLGWIAKEDNQTKASIIRKLQAMDIQVGFSTSAPDLTSVISLSEYFGDISINRTDFFCQHDKGQSASSQTNMATA
ncbi:peptidase M13, N-terminal domain-containing protein [Choanephora cucurbitarum]|nr:peptidase M13, N-terminal domain-containing protein [Choanephora cucurbitarum]